MKQFKTIIYSLFTVILTLGLLTSCEEEKCPTCNTTDPMGNYTYKTPKYIFYFIGDGMATAQINVTEQIFGKLAMTDFKSVGMATTYALNSYITESAAAGTALATGKKTNNDIISMDPGKTIPYKSIATMAKEKGMKVGIITSVSIDHATPACFYANDPSRKNVYNISCQMATAGFDYYGGGYSYGNWDSKNPKDIEAKMIAAGYTLTKNRSEFQSVKAGTKCWAYTTVDADAALNYEMDRTANEISLAEFTSKGIELLNNPKGFFMMVEGGKVDWANHANDVVAQSKDMIAFDEAIKVAIEFYNQHPDETLIVIAGDHECGGLTTGFASTGYANAFDILKHQKISYQFFTEKVKNWKTNKNVTFTMALDSVKHFFGLGNEILDAKLALSTVESKKLEEAFTYSIEGTTNYSKEELAVHYGGYDAFTVTITHILNNKAGIGWTSYAHTGVPIPVLAKGQGELLFNGYYDNTDIAKRIISIGKLEKK